MQKDILCAFSFCYNVDGCYNNHIYIYCKACIGVYLNMCVYRKVVYKSRGLRAIFQLFGAASGQVWLLFGDCFYAMF